jgi:hypothetical protein
MQQTSTGLRLKIASAIVIGFGPVVALAVVPALAGVTQLFTDLVFWPVDGAQSLTAPETRLYLAITGGITTGWGVMLWLVSTKLYPREPELARAIILWSVCTWFAVDSSASIAAGVPGNAVLNIVFLLMFVVPLWRPADPVAAHPAE